MNFMKAHSNSITMKEVAEKAGVSQATVSRVLSNHPSVSPAKKKRVMEWVRKLNFEPNYSAKTLAAKSSQLIGVVLPDLQNPFFTELLFHIERIANQNGYTIIVCNSGGDLQKEKAIIRLLKARQVDGLLIGLAKASSEILETIRKDHTKTVVITQNYPGIDCVASSHSAGGKLAAEYLLDGKVEDFIYFGIEDDDKFYGFKEKLLENGIPRERIHVIGNQEWYFNTLQRGQQVLFQFLHEFKPQGKLGVFTLSDMYAVAVLQAAQSLGLRIPQDISIVGFDNIFICDAVQPKLTSISQPIEEIASMSLDMLLKRIDETGENTPPRHIILQQVIVRGET